MTTMQREALFEPGSEDAGDRRGGVEPATVIAVEASAAGGPDAGRRAARGVVQLDRPGRPTFGAIFAQIAGYRPAPGDRVLVARGPRGERYVVAVIEATAGIALALALPDGATAALAGDGLEIRDAAGRLIVRYADGVTRIEAPTRDLVLAAPAGRVVLEAAQDVVIEAARDVVQRAGRRVELASAARGAPGAGPNVSLRLDPNEASIEAPSLRLSARVAEVVTGSAALVAETLRTTVDHASHGARRYEIVADHLVETAREAVRDIRGLFESRLGRARTLVREDCTLRAETVAIVAEKEASLDGERVLLG